MFSAAAAVYARHRCFSRLICWCLGLVAVSLPAAMRVDARTQFPLALELEPLLYETTLTASDGAPADYFGYHVAVDGDTAAISAPGQDRVYVFVRSNGIWVEQDTLEPPAGEDSEPAFGIVAVSGDTILVGAPTADINGEAGGAAYVFERSGSSWSGPEILAPLDRQNNFRFGQDVALDGSTAIVGAGGVDAAYIFVRSGGSWREEAKLTGGIDHGGFGWTVALDDDVAVVGAPYEDHGANTSQGSAYIFKRSGLSWNSSPQRVMGSDTISNSQFGIDVAIDGDTILVGATRAVYVFTGDGVVERAKLTAPEASAFGYSLGLRDGRAIVGALFENPASSYFQGAAYVFEGSGTSWAQTNRLTQPPPTPSHDAGYRVAFDGETAVLGSYNNRNATGAAFVYSMGAPPPPPPPPTQLSAPVNLRATVIGSTVSLAWIAPTSGTPTGYVVEGGTVPGQTLASIPTGSTATSFTFSAPTGSFFVRLHATSASGRSPDSNEIRIFVNVPQLPSAPTNLLGLANGSNLSLSWETATAGGAPTAFILDVSGALTTSLPLPQGETFSYTGVPPGTYTFAVRAVNSAGTSAASPSVTLAFPSACPGPPEAPTNFVVSRAGSHLSVSWEPPSVGPAVSSYVLKVTGALNMMLPLSTRSASGVVPSGTYDLSVLAVNSCGAGVATVPQSVTVP
jgi:hypothetical protein